jgi:hypothetical protein
MIISEKHLHELEKLYQLHELEKLYQFLHGAHNASNDENASSTFHQACHNLQEIINKVKSGNL